MSFVWKRLQRVNKRAVKYRVLFELRELIVEGCSKWQPNQLVVVLTRRSRRRCSQPMFWEPTIRNPYLGSVQWNLPEILDIEVTLFKDSHNRYEPKDWTLTIEDIPQMGKPRRIGSMIINISDYVDEQFSVPSRHEFFKMKLNITSKKIKKANITFMLGTQFLKEGKATDDDMQSLASLMSLNGPDPAPDLDDDDTTVPFEYSDQATNQILEMTEQFNQFLNDGNQDKPTKTKEKENEIDGFKTDQNALSNGESNIWNNNDAINEIKSNHYHNEDENMNKITNNGSYGDNHIKIIMNERESITHEHMNSFELNKHHPNAMSNSNNKNNAESVINFEFNHDGQIRSDSFTVDDDSSASRNSSSAHHHSRSGVEPYESHEVFLKPKLHSNESIHASETKNNMFNVALNNDEPNKPGTSFNDNIHMPIKGQNFSSSLEILEKKFDDSAQSINNNKEESNIEPKIDQLDSKSSSMNHYSAQEDLLRWCQEVTKEYSDVRITNMTTSWRNGIAFGAIIHHFKPDLIDLDSLQPSDIVGNCKKVFDVATSLGIPKLIDPQDMIVLNVPDKLSVMTYLYQMRSFFTGKTILNSNISSSLYLTEVDDNEQKNKQEDIKAKCMDLFNKFEELDKLCKTTSNDNGDSMFNDNQQKLEDKQQNLTNKTLNQQQLMTRKQLLYPFDSDSDEEIEICKKDDYDVEKSSPTDSEDKSISPLQPKEPIRKRLQFIRRDNKNNIPSSKSTSSFNSLHVMKSSSPTSQSNNVQVAPGLIDLSSSNNSLQRTYSAPNCQNHSVELKKRQREEELRERARKLIESVRIDSNNQYHSNRKLSKKEAERMDMLREQARRLIAEAKQGFTNMNSTFTSLDSSLSSNSNSTNATPQMISPSESLSNNLSTIPDEETFSKDRIGQQSMDNFTMVEFNFYKFKDDETSKQNDFKQEIEQETKKLKENHGKITSKREKSTKSQNDEECSYNDFPESYESLQEELKTIANEQKKIDHEASILEKRLRKLMESGGNKRLEENLIQNWFVLVNKRNAIIRRQMQLNILEKEADMNRRYEELNAELRNLMLIEDLHKTDEQRTREKELLEELVKIVDKRDELVRHLDNQEKAIEEDEFVESQTQRPLAISSTSDAADKNCSIQ